MVESQASMQASEPPTLELRVELVERRVRFESACVRKRSSKLLLVGSISGFLGFFVAFIIGVLKANVHGSRNHNGEVFPSGRAYFPSTVSEMVHDPDSPAGKCFFAFELIGALFIFLSYYPSSLRNAYIGDSYSVLGTGISWTTFRQFVPAPGMMLLAVITITPSPQADILDYFCIGLHIFGAVMMFAGYFVVEACTVGWGPIPAFNKTINKAPVMLSGQERRIRKLLLHSIFGWYLVFCITQVLVGCSVFFPKDQFDQWGKLHKDDGIRWRREIYLVDTAHGVVRMLKILSYASEVACGLCLIASLQVIWYYCDERHYELMDELVPIAAQKPTMSPELKEWLSQRHSPVA